MFYGEFAKFSCGYYTKADFYILRCFDSMSLVHPVVPIRIVEKLLEDHRTTKVANEDIILDSHNGSRTSASIFSSTRTKWRVWTDDC